MFKEGVGKLEPVVNTEGKSIALENSNFIWNSACKTKIKT